MTEVSRILYKFCALIPTFNHYDALEGIIQRLTSLNIDIFIVDDGSNEETQKALKRLTEIYPALNLLRLPINQGKGIAIKKGLSLIQQAGYTHALQLDADGQHSLENLERFMDLSLRNPQALISGQPIYDKSMPLSRKIGRWITHVWVWIETLSFRITDSMCGFRIYPVDKSLEILENFPIGARMDFDTEIMVRLFWARTPMIMSPVAVTYPSGNLSNFDVLHDNWRITKMHTRLFFGMLKNLPQVLFHRPDYKDLDLPKDSVYWASLRERGSLFGLFFFAWCYRLLGKNLCLFIGAPVVFYFYLTSSCQRNASKDFLTQVFAYKKQGKKATFWDGYYHFMAFFKMVLDKFSAWTGRLDFSQIDTECQEKLNKLMEHKKGGLLLVSHLGNMEVCRAISCSDHKNRLHILLHQKNSQRFYQFLKAFNPLSSINIIEVTEIGPDTIIFLKEQICRGDWVVIAGDRVPVHGNGRTSYASFLGRKAPFSQGPYVLASLLECPIYTALAFPEGKKFKVFVELFAEKITIDRQNRQKDLEQLVQRYATYLESYCIRYPYQWFNFFDFWADRP